MPISPFSTITVKRYAELISVLISSAIEAIKSKQDEPSKVGMSGIYLIHVWLGINALIIVLLGCFAGALLTFSKAISIFDIGLVIFIFSLSIITIKAYPLWKLLTFETYNNEGNWKEEEDIISSEFYRWSIFDDVLGSTLIQLIPFSVGIMIVVCLKF
jgi:hypothetical protein